MKFDQYLASYLYENKLLTLQGTGTFTLESNVSISHDHDKSVHYPIEGLSFKYNPKAETDNDLIVYLQKKLGKIQPLVRSDLESYLANMKQFINLGKPYTIEGIGTLIISNRGEYEFTPGSFMPVKEELNPKRENEEHNYPVRQSSSAGRVFVIVLIVIAGLAALGGIGWGVSNLFSSQKHSSASEETATGYADTTAEETPVGNADSNTKATVTNSPATDTSSATAPGFSHASGKDSAWYKWVFETTAFRERAVTRVNQLNKMHSFVKYETIRGGDSSVRYRLFLPYKAATADTAHIRDSLQIFFGGRVRIVKY